MLETTGIPMASISARPLSNTLSRPPKMISHFSTKPTKKWPTPLTKPNDPPLTKTSAAAARNKTAASGRWNAGVLRQLDLRFGDVSQVSRASGKSPPKSNGNLGAPLSHGFGKALATRVWRGRRLVHHSFSWLNFRVGVLVGWLVGV